MISKLLTFLATDDAKVYSLATANVAGGVGQAVVTVESVLKVVLILIQIAIGVVTFIYIYRKSKAQNKDK